jgi:hypothetical protein
VNTLLIPVLPLHLASWSAPAWATTVDTSGDQIEYSRTIGTVAPAVRGTNDVVTVTLVQRDEILAGLKRVDVVRHPAGVLVGGVHLSRQEAERLRALLDTATALIGDSPA